MAIDPKKRQKKLARKAAQAKEKKKLANREKSLGLSERLANATKFPVLHCRVADTLETTGIGAVVFSRISPSGHVAVAVFLVDSYCLGIKDAFAHILNSRGEYESKFGREMQLKSPGRNVAPSEAKKLLEDAAAYARNLGFAPSPEFRTAMALFGDIDSSECDIEFEFGKDGKPFFVSGPNDSRSRCRHILNTLAASCGPDGFDYLIALESEMSAETRSLDVGSDDDIDDDELDSWPDEAHPRDSR